MGQQMIIVGGYIISEGDLVCTYGPKYAPEGPWGIVTYIEDPNKNGRCDDIILLKFDGQDRYDWVTLACIDLCRSYKLRSIEATAELVTEKGYSSSTNSLFDLSFL